MRKSLDSPLKLQLDRYLGDVMLRNPLQPNSLNSLLHALWPIVWAIKSENLPDARSWCIEYEPNGPLPARPLLSNWYRLQLSLDIPSEGEIINLRLSWILDHNQQLLFCLLLFQQVGDVKAECVVASSVAASLNSIDKDLEQEEQLHTWSPKRGQV